MYYRVANQLVVVQGTDAFTQAVSMNGANQVLFDVVVVELVDSVDTALIVTLQEGNDLDNWKDVVSTPSITEVGYTSKQSVSGISAQYVRLNFSMPGVDGGMAVVAAGIDVADL